MLRLKISRSRIVRFSDARLANAEDVDFGVWDIPDAQVYCCLTGLALTAFLSQLGSPFVVILMVRIGTTDQGIPDTASRNVLPADLLTEYHAALQS